jgi:hydroxymethylbilane synthase
MLIIGSRGSSLALTQTTWVKNQISKYFPDVEVTINIIKTSADSDQISSLRAPATVGVFVKELEQALLDNAIDLAVHSMKDVPTQIAPGLRIAAIPEREDARDALVTLHAKSLSELPSGSRIGTGRVRRQAQILALRPDLKIMDIRGNVDTRLKKLQDGMYDALILANAGLRRLGLEDRISALLEFDQMLPAPGQGALAIETRIDDPKIEEIADALNHPGTEITVLAERNFLKRMGGGCNVPVAAYARLQKNRISLDGLVASPDGQSVIRDSIQHDIRLTEDAVAALADRILSRGGREILEKTF